MKPDVIIQAHESQRIITPQNHSLDSWIEIDKAALEHNLMSYKSIIGSALFAPVVKSNAYGHGIELVAKICDQSLAVDSICTVNIAEALFLRSVGIKKPILVLSIVHGNIAEAMQHDITLSVHDLESACALSQVATHIEKTVNVHVKVDTGLSRRGIPVADAFEAIRAIHGLPNIITTGMFTHFAEAESTDQAFTNHQIKKFNELVEQLKEQGITIPLQHTSCSAAATGNAASHGTMVRAGIGIYGLWPSTDNKIMTQTNHPAFFLKPVLTWKTRIMQIKKIPAGSWIGYDRTHQVAQQTRIAILPIGYWDGYDRQLSNKAQVLINNQLAPVVGRVAMNLTIIDITNIQAAVGDDVTLLSSHQGITADDMAAHCQTINYEIVTRINPLLPRLLK
jgi:alanine racemase